MTEKSSPGLLETLAQQLEGATFPVVLCDTQLNVVFQNKYARENVQVLSFPAIVSSLFPPEEFESFLQRILAGESLRVETTVGDLLGTFLSVSPLREGEEVVGAIVTLVPNGAILHRPSDLVTNSAAIFSNAFRQPLTDIFAALSVIGRNLQARGDRSLGEYLQTINAAAYRILRNTGNLVHRMSSYYSHRPQPEVVDLWERMAELLEASVIVLRSGDYRLSYQLPQGQALVRCDFPSISVAFINLLSNACRHGGRSGLITVTGKVVGSAAMVTVTDEGAGISQELAERVFAPYSTQVDGGLPFGGLGMGLPVAKQIIQEAGGNIAVESVPGEYTKLIFTLPLVEDAEPHPRISLESGSVVYLRDRFSPVYVGLCDVIPPPEQ